MDFPTFLPESLQEPLQEGQQPIVTPPPAQQAAIPPPTPPAGALLPLAYRTQPTNKWVAWWNALNQKQQYGLIGGGAFAVVLLLATAPALLSSRTVIFDPPRGTSSDPDVLLQSATADLQEVEAQTALQVELNHAEMLEQEAQRILLEAQRQVAPSSGARCAGRKLGCALSQFERDAIAAYSGHARKRDWIAAIAALEKIQAIELARAGNALAPEPEVSLTRLALEVRLSKREQVSEASAESIAADIVGETGDETDAHR